MKPRKIAHIPLKSYQSEAARTDQQHVAGLEGLPFPLLGLFGEVGSLLSVLKKKQRDKASFLGYTAAVHEEFGDVMWYFTNICSRADLSLEAIARDCKMPSGSTAEVRRFADVQSPAVKTGEPNSLSFETALIALAGHVGVLLNGYSKEMTSDVLRGHLVSILSSLIDAADKAGVNLDGALSENVLKIDGRWPREPAYTELFDGGFGYLEQLPRAIEMHIIEEERSGKAYVIQRCHEINIGNTLTDNKITPDDYRFHDVFHLAYAAVLGWSPVLRALFKVKRKSKPGIDEAEDGQRAIIIEEGISTMIFHRAEQLDYFRDIKALDYPLLKQIIEFVQGYEVAICPPWQWEQAILEGYKVFRLMQEHRRGIVTADLLKRTVTFQKLTK